MIKVTCAVPTIGNPKITKITVESNDTFDTDERCVILNIDGLRYIVPGEDLITAVETALVDTKFIYRGWRR